VLDVGCGDGAFAGTLWRHRSGVAPVFAGVDLSFDQVKKASRVGVYASTIVADMRRLPFADAAFATAYSNCVLEHVPELQSALSEIGRVLRPGAALYFTVPTPRLNEWNVWSSTLRMLRLWWVATQVNQLRRRLQDEHYYLDVASTRRLAEGAGLEWRAASYFLSEPCTRVLSFFFLPDLPAWVLKRLVGRWLFVPGLHRLCVEHIQVPLLRRCLAMHLPAGSGLFAIVRKRQDDP
jgi:SAM-dependent methyltransferase